MSMNKLTPVLFVDDIALQLPFWKETLGFETVVEVPETEGSEKTGFMILKRDQVEVMLQTWKSIEEDTGWRERSAQSSLFIEVSDIDDIERRLQSLDKVIPRRKTFYGATEIGVRDPAGNLVTFAQFEA